MKVFISYRRDDSEEITGRIYDHLRNKIPKNNIFKDVQSISTGEDYRAEISKGIRESKYILVVIGSHWLALKEGKDKPRLFDENDVVRAEIEEAMELKKILIPVLVSNATMPSKDELPLNIRNFNSINAIKVRNDPDFETDIAKLLKVVKVGGLRRTLAYVFFIVLLVLIIFKSFPYLKKYQLNDTQKKQIWTEEVSDSYVHSTLTNKINIDMFNREFGCENDGCMGVISSQIYGSYSLKTNKRDLFVTIATTRPSGEHCSACQVAISIFEFTKSDLGYRLTASDINVFKTGSNGEINVGECKSYEEEETSGIENDKNCTDNSIELVEIGDDIYGLVFRNDGEMNGGVKGTDITIYTKLRGKYQLVYIGSLAYSDEIPDLALRTNYKVTIRFIKKGSSFYDLEETMYDFIDKKETKKIYKFNGTSYTSEMFIK